MALGYICRVLIIINGLSKIYTVRMSSRAERFAYATLMPQCTVVPSRMGRSKEPLVSVSLQCQLAPPAGPESCGALSPSSRPNIIISQSPQAANQNIRCANTKLCTQSFALMQHATLATTQCVSAHVLICPYLSFHCQWPLCDLHGIGIKWTITYMAIHPPLHSSCSG